MIPRSLSVVGFVLLGCASAQPEPRTTRAAVSLINVSHRETGDIGNYRVSFFAGGGYEACWEGPEASACVTMKRGELSEVQASAIRRAQNPEASRVPMKRPHTHSPVCEAAWSGRTEWFQLVDDRACVYAAESLCLVAGDLVGVDLIRASARDDELPTCTTSDRAL